MLISVMPASLELLGQADDRAELVAADDLGRCPGHELPRYAPWMM
jgi:hypothetical protein